MVQSHTALIDMVRMRMQTKLGLLFFAVIVGVITYLVLFGF
jgi:hypothetical protein